MTNITISYDYQGQRKPRTVGANVVGPLAYHSTIGEAGFWTVTHLGSGRALCRFAVSRKQAKEIAVALSELNGWDAVDTEIIDNVVLKQQCVETLNRMGIPVKIVPNKSTQETTTKEAL